MRFGFRLAAALAFALVLSTPALASPVGYYREPALSGNTLVFAAEGDLWKVPVAGGVATRLTTAPGEEGTPAISPDGKTLAFIATYEGPAEVYTMPLAGGLPTRRTYGSERPQVTGWTPDGEVIYRTRERSTLPDYQLAVIDVSGENGAGIGAMIPLSQAADGTYDPSGKTLYFTRLPFQGSHTKRYKGGTAQNIWSYTEGAVEAEPLTSDYPGTSKRPMWWEGRIYFASDRDGTMNLWSMKPDGSDLVQHTHHQGWDVQSPYLEGGRIAYQLGADIHLYDIAADRDTTLPITLESDLDQTREQWIEKPMDYLTAAHVSPDGDRVVLTARGEVFVAPKDRGRFVKVERAQDVRYRDARFMPDGKTLLAFSDQSGEVELWTLPANGVGAPVQLTDDATTLRWEAVPSPDGKFIAHDDKKQRLFLYDVEHKTNRQIDSSEVDRISDLAWSPDSKWLAYVKVASNQFHRILIYSIADGSITPVTTDRFDSYSPAWSADGKWLYLLSDRNLTSAVRSVWGSYQPEPYLAKTTEIYQIALVPGLRSPFAPPDELEGSTAEAKKPEEKKDTAASRRRSVPEKKEERAAEGPPEVKVDKDGIVSRIERIPIPPGNYGSLSATEKALFWVAVPPTETKRKLMGAAITNKDLEAKTVLEDIKGYELSQDGKKLMVHKGDGFYVVDADPKPADLEKAGVDLSGWMLSVAPREEWRQMFDEAWRLERDYFYDPGMNGVDWPAMKIKYRPLVDRVTSREELSDLLAQMVSELSALHIFVYGGDMREGKDQIGNAFLGGVFARDEASGGYRVEHVYRTDPDEPGQAAPLAQPNVNVKVGDVITMVNGAPALSAPDLGALLRNQAGKQVLLHVKPASGPERDVVAVPIASRREFDLRYDQWEYTRRLETDSLSGGKIGYVHLRAMGARDYTNWARDYYPVYTREGLIVDVRHNNGGNIDSWILEKLLRKAWAYWSQPVGNSPTWNMQYAFRGHMAVLCDERTASDGELFSEGFRRLGLGKVIGTRTWGGEIWLSSSNFLVDGGIATAAEYGVYGPKGTWLIEGHGVEPDITVDNLPHATFGGKDAQLEAAVKYLEQQIREKPVTEPEPPPYPDKSGK
jgi:tricorn protease